MKERPILFSGPMVRALLDGRKTQTRRVVKHRIYPNGFHFDGHDILCHEDFLPPSAMLMDVRRGKTAYRTSNLEGWELECPHGVPGDRLWVKETYRLDVAYDNDRPSAVSAKAAVWWEACGAVGNGVSGRLRPSIHMPRWASRITLRITDARVERLQDISEADAVAEGLYKSYPDEQDREWFRAYVEEQSGSPPTAGEWEALEEGVWRVPGVPQGWGMTTEQRRSDQWGPTPQFCYRQLWNHINGPGSWDANPWVWAVSFERVTP